MLTSPLLSLLAHVRLAPFRLSLDTYGFRPTVALLRSVWGAALHQLDQAAYDAVFAPAMQTAPPGYLLASDPADPSIVHWRLLGTGLLHEESLRRAWDIACGMGLGPARRLFIVRRFLLLGWDDQVAELPEPWSLDRARWPLSGDPAATPCRLVFPAGLRLMRDGQLLTWPTLADIAVATLRRLYPLLSDPARADLDELHEPLVALARRQMALPWRGERHDLQRWSARQKREVELHGVRGELELPEGPGPLWPLLAAARWLHVGKGTTIGLGQMIVGKWPPLRHGRRAALRKSNLNKKLRSLGQATYRTAGHYRFFQRLQQRLWLPLDIACADRQNQYLTRRLRHVSSPWILDCRLCTRKGG